MTYYFHKFRHYKKDHFKLKEKEEKERRKSHKGNLVVSAVEEASTLHEVLPVIVLDFRS